MWFTRQLKVLILCIKEGIKIDHFFFKPLIEEYSHLQPDCELKRIRNKFDIKVIDLHTINDFNIKCYKLM